MNSPPKSSSGKQISFVFLMIFTFTYLFWAARQIQENRNEEFLLYISVVGVVMGVILFLHRRFRFSLLSLWAMSAWGLFHMMGGLFQVPPDWPIAGKKAVLYNWWMIPHILKFDQFVHAYGFGITTWIIWQALCASLRKCGSRLPSRGGVLFLCALASMGLGSLNEIIEFFATLTMAETNVGGYTNTCLDLVSNTVGAFLMAVILFIGSRKKDAL